MSIVSAKEMLLSASENGYAVGAFNVTNIIQMQGVIQAAINKNAPLIIQTSMSPATSIGVEVFGAVYRIFAKDAPVPICLHLDHCTDVELCKRAAIAGYTNIMIDGSHHEFDENIKVTREISDFCHNLDNVSVEGELGTVSGVEDQIIVAEDEAALCNPDQVMEYVKRSGIDLLAPAIGTAHGVYTTKNPKLDIPRLATIYKMLNGEKSQIPLVIHGGTGLEENTVKKLIKEGGAKYNISTDMKYVLIDSVAKYINSNREEYNPGKIDAAMKTAITARVEWWIDILGCENKA